MKMVILRLLVLVPTALAAWPISQRGIGTIAYPVVLCPGNYVNLMGAEQPSGLADHTGDTGEDVLASSSFICRCIEPCSFRLDHEMAESSINYDDMEIFVAID